MKSEGLQRMIGSWAWVTSAPLQAGQNIGFADDRGYDRERVARQSRRRGAGTAFWPLTREGKSRDAGRGAACGPEGRDHPWP